MIKKVIDENLNKQQSEAALWIDTPSLILAWAWSGKTRVLTYKIANLVFEQKINPLNILAVTFTNKAANEMKQRLWEISNELYSDDSFSWNNSFKLDNRSLKWVWTFHSIFLKILKHEIDKTDIWYDKNFWIYDTWESLSLLKNIINEKWMKDKLEVKEVKRKISALKNEWVNPNKFLHLVNNEWEEDVAKIYELYQKSLIESNSMDFDDLLLYTKQLFENNPDILDKYKNQFKYILVDEAQDTNQIQFEIIKLIWQEWNVTFIWDDFQSIYWRRWAVMDNFLKLERRWPEIKTFKLEINYRSKEHIVQAGNAIILNNENQYQKNVRSNRWWDDHIRVFGFKDEYDEANQIVELISKFKEQKWLNWSDFSILYRTNAQSQPFEQILLQEWVPYKVWWWFKFFERKEIKDIVSYIKYILNPKDNIALRRIINTPSRKIWQTTINKIQDFATENGFDMNYVIENIETLPIKINSWTTNSIKSFSTSMKFLENQLKSLSPENFIQTLVNNIRYKEYLITSEGKDKAEEKMENIWQLINMASKYKLDDYEDWIEAIQAFLEEVSILIDLEDDESEESDMVKLMTVHSSKWLEFPIVFIVWLEENIFPLSKARFEKKEMEEERRLMYVAITRAKDLLFLSHADSRMKRWQLSFNKESRFIEEIPEYLLKFYNIEKTEQEKTSFNEWEIVKHKLFWKWEVVESWGEQVIVRFENPKFWIRKMDSKFLEKD